MRRSLKRSLRPPSAGNEVGSRRALKQDAVQVGEGVAGSGAPTCSVRAGTPRRPAAGYIRTATGAFVTRKGGIVGGEVGRT